MEKGAKIIAEGLNKFVIGVGTLLTRFSAMPTAENIQ